MTTGPRTTGNETRWQSRRFAAACLRVAIFAVPITVGFLAGAFVSKALPQPTSAYEIVFWWAAIVAVATVSSTATDRIARRLLPLTVLLRMTMLFPDAAPSRLKMARRAGNVSELRRRIHNAQNGVGDPDLAEMAELILSLSAALSNHDRRTRGHSERTRAYTDMIAEEMGLPEADRDRLRWAALLHDVGKLEVPAEILNKDSTLTDEEWELVKQHPINGMKLVAPLIPWLGEWAKTIEHHHERYDGSGYPHGLAGTGIALGARIVSVADAYDVMTSGRSYQNAMTPSTARREVASMAGEQFDPVVARALMNISLGKLRWSTGPLAVLADIPLIRGLPQMGRDVAMVMTTSAVMTTGFITGAVPVPDGVSITPDQIVEVVIAGAGLRSDPVLPPGSPSDLPLTSGDPTASAEDTVNTPPPDGPGGDPDETTTSLGEDGVTTTTLGTTTTTPPGTTTTAAPSAPVANDDRASTAEDTPVTIAVLGNDSDPDGDLDPASLAVTASGALGSTSVSGGTLRYSPARDTNGTDAVTYRICDLGGRCDTATVTITVDPVNDPPVTPVRSATTDEGVVISVPLGYTDPDDDVLRCSMAAPPAVGAATVPGNCSALQYSPPAQYDGEVTVSINVTDGTVTVTSQVVITVVGTNEPPVAVADSATSDGSAVTIPVLSNDSDPDGDPLTLTSVSAPSSGTATRSGSSVVYTPVEGFSGTATFSYQVCDDGGLCATGAVSVSVTQDDATVVANDDSASVKRNGKTTISVLGNDTGPYDPTTLTVGSPSQGLVTVLGGSGRVRYEAANGFTGVATFSYTVCSVAGSCDSATVTIQVG